MGKAKNGLLSILILGLLVVNTPRANAYLVTYKEQWYRLYHLHLIQYPDDTMENIIYLEKALKADFANPLYALASIDDEVQWEKYRYLFMMHLNLKLIEQYVFLGNKYNKRNAYFYNTPWKNENLESLKTAEACFKTALFYWQGAKDWAGKASAHRFYRTELPRVRFWQDEAVRIEEGTLDYEKILNRELSLLGKVRSKFMSYGEQTKE